MSAAQAAVQSDVVTVLLALLNVLQTLCLAVMADRSRRVRRATPRNRREDSL